MKYLIFTLNILLSCLISSAQSFEGKIVYKNTIKSNMSSVTDEQFISMLGNIDNYYMKGGEYKSETNGKLILWQLYKNKENKLFNKLASSETLLYNDGAVNPDSVLSSQMNHGITNILGYSCDELILNCKSGVQKYYFSSRFPIDSKLYSRHRFGNWYTYLSLAHAIPLKMIITNAQFTMETTATEVKQIKLDDTMFDLPKDVKIAKSPY